MKNLIANFLGVLVVCFFGACASEDTSSENPRGSVVMKLTATHGKEHYRLSDAIIVVQGTEGTFRLYGDNKEFVEQELPEGTYTVTLLEPWTMQIEAENGKSEPVEAVLVSDNPQNITVVAGELLQVVLRFQVGNEQVPLGNGRVRVEIEVTAEAQGDGMKPVNKCGMNGFSFSEPCGSSGGTFRFVDYDCHGGYAGQMGGPTSCKPSSLWLEYVRQECEGHCNF